MKTFLFVVIILSLTGCSTNINCFSWELNADHAASIEFFQSADDAVLETTKNQKSAGEFNLPDPLGEL